MSKKRSLLGTVVFFGAAVVILAGALWLDISSTAANVTADVFLAATADLTPAA